MRVWGVGLGPRHTPLARAPWPFRLPWSRRRASHQDQVAGTGSHSDFPVLISFTDADLADTDNGGHVGQADGGDILFTSANGISQLKHEIEDYDNTTGKVLAWVKVSSLSTYVDTEIYVYYGNASAADQWDPSNVWTNGFDAVYHLHEDVRDSRNSHNGTNYGSVDYANEKIGNSQDFENSTTDYIDTGAWSVSGDEITIQGWMKAESFATSDARIFAKANNIHLPAW